MVPEVTVSVTYSRSDGVTVSRTVVVRKSTYDRAPMTAFRANAKRRAIEAVNAVLGTKPDTVITLPDQKAG